MVGWRVDLPNPVGKCSTDLENLLEASRELASTYSWRAAYNRNAIYAGGLLLLGTAAATAGMGAAGAAGLSIALLGVSGGFVSGAMLLFHNADLAAAYTTAEKAVNNAIANWRSVPQDAKGAEGGNVPPDTKSGDAANVIPDAKTAELDCARYTALLQAVTNAQNQLEADRLSIAQGAATTEIPAIRTQVADIQATLAAVPTRTPKPPKTP
jgi:hypothetical protein